MLYLAIDQHSKQLTVNVRDEAGQVVIRKQVSTRGEVPREFLKQLAERGGADGYVAIVEVCGFNDWLLDLLPLCGCREIVLIQPDPTGEWARIFLGVHSSLEAVGLTAVLSSRLAEAGISANVVAGLFHDHLFVPWDRREEAIDCLTS